MHKKSFKDIHNRNSPGIAGSFAYIAWVCLALFVGIGVTWSAFFFTEKAKGFVHDKIDFTPFPSTVPPGSSPSTGISPTQSTIPAILNNLTNKLPENVKLNSTFLSSKTKNESSRNMAVKAEAYIIGNIETGEIFLQKNTEKKVPIASISKLITAVVTTEEIPVDASILITRDVVNTLGNSGGLKKGERVLAKDLMYPMLMVSSNDAAEAFADYYGRNEFLAKMNQKVKDIGAWSTKFSDPSGLSKNNISTAADLFLITRWVAKYHPELFEITTQKTKKSPAHTWVNQTRLLNFSSYIGGKIGYTDEALKTATAIFSLKNDEGVNEKIGVVVLRSPDREKDIRVLIDHIKNNYGYKE